MGVTRISVLLIEDNEGDARLIEEYLVEAKEVTFELQKVDRLSSGKERLAAGGVDIVLLDLSLPDSQGLDTFAKLRTEASSVPVVILTGLDDETLAVQAVQEGAQDYVVKGDMTARSLGRAIRYAVERKEMQDRLLSSERRAAVGSLVTGFAHDFDEILRSIISFADLLQTRADVPAPAKRYVDTIGKQGRRAAHVIRQLMDFSRQVPGARRRMQLLPFLQEAVAFFQDTLPENVTLALEADPADPAEYVVEGDSIQLHQVLANLIRNAWEAMPDGGRIWCQLFRKHIPAKDARPLRGMMPGDWIGLAVSDAGVGIPPSDLIRVFEPFFTTKPRGDQTGLGLPQVYGIVRQHGGFIDVESRVGLGTMFTVFLPALPATPPGVAEGRDVPEGKGVE